MEIYRELFAEKKGEKAADDDQKKKRDDMRNFIKATMQTDQIDRVDYEELKKEIEGEGLISRIKYRKQV